MTPSRVTFKSIRVVPHFGSQELGGFDLFWEVASSLSGLTFLVETSETDDGPWVAVDNVINPTADSFLLGCTDKSLVFDAVRWFRINALSGGTVLATSPAMDHRNSLNPRDYRYYRDLLRRQRLGLANFTGAPGYLLRRKVYGEVCRACCSEILEQPMSSECAVCYGTGITGGYWPAFPMDAEWDGGGPARTANTSKEASGPVQVAKSQIKLFPVPDAKGDDCWVDRGTGYRYLVEKLDPQKDDIYRGSLVSQQLQISRLPPKHPIYNFPLS